MAGTTIGMFLKGGLPDRFEKTVKSAAGLSTLIIGISGTLTEMFYVNTDGSQVTVQNEEYNTSQIVTINFDGTQFKLLDNSYQNSGNTKWQINQDKIN